MKTHKKKMVSLRLDQADLRRIKESAARLGTTDSEFLRFAIGRTLRTFAPLHDGRARGRELLPLFLEHGPELSSRFHLDAHTLDECINAGVEDEGLAVSEDDITLLATQDCSSDHLSAKLSERLGRPVPAAEAANVLRDYLLERYQLAGGEQPVGDSPAESGHQRLGLVNK